MDFKSLGKRDYLPIWEYQKEWLENALNKKKHSQPIQEEVLMLEHSPVYTLGKSANPDHLLVNPAFLKTIGAESFKIERGGDITFHGPGQLVVYPLLNLENHGFGVKKYIYFLEKVIINLLQEYGITSCRIEGKTGIWIDAGLEKERKIAAIGIKCSRYLTIHGLALNVNTDLTYFDHIVPCGLSNRQVTSIEQELGNSVNMAEIITKFEQIFKKELNAVYELD